MSGDQYQSPATDLRQQLRALLRQADTSWKTASGSLGYFLNNRIYEAMATGRAELNREDVRPDEQIDEMAWSETYRWFVTRNPWRFHVERVNSTIPGDFSGPDLVIAHRKKWWKITADRELRS